MRPLSASEAIGPALERTKDVLARPFRFRTFLKIAAVAFFAEMGGGLNSSFSNRSGGLHDLPPAMLAFIVAFAVIVGVISVIVGLILFYVGSRLQLVLVNLVAARQTYVSPLWRMVSPPTWRWIGLKVLFFLAVLLCTLPFTIPVILFFVHHGFGSFSSVSFFSGMHVAAIILFIGAVILFVLAIIAAYTLVRDLALPFLALENLSISDTLSRLRGVVGAEPGQAALYVILRLILGLVFGLGAEIAVVLILVVSFIPPAIIGFLLWLALHKAGTAGTVALVGLGILGGVIFVCWAVCVTVGLVGAVLTFNQAYALYFLGGRYPLLGDLLDRSTPPPSYAYPGSLQPPQPTYPPPLSGPPPAPTSF